MRLSGGVGPVIGWTAGIMMGIVGLISGQCDLSIWAFMSAGWAAMTLREIEMNHALLHRMDVVLSVAEAAMAKDDRKD